MPDLATKTVYLHCLTLLVDLTYKTVSNMTYNVSSWKLHHIIPQRV